MSFVVTKVINETKRYRVNVCCLCFYENKALNVAVFPWPATILLPILEALFARGVCSLNDKSFMAAVTSVTPASVERLSSSGSESGVSESELSERVSFPEFC